MVRFLIFLFLLGLSWAASADDWPAPQERDFVSPNGTLQGRLLIDLYTEDKNPRIRIEGGQDRPLVYELINQSAPVEIVLLDDGTLITFDEWYRRGYECAAVIYDPRGRLIAKRSLQGMLPHELGDIPYSTSSIYWLREPFEWRVIGQGQDRAVEVTLFNEDRLALRLRDGRASYVEVEDPGEDPKRLINRAQSLNHQEDQEEKARLLRRALALDPKSEIAYYELAETLCRLSRLACEESLMLLEKGSNLALPAWSESKPRLNLQTLRAKNLELLGKFSEARAAYEAVLRIDPEFRFAAAGLESLKQRPRSYDFPDDSGASPETRVGFHGSRRDFIATASKN